MLVSISAFAEPRGGMPPPALKMFIAYPSSSAEPVRTTLLRPVIRGMGLVVRAGTLYIGTGGTDTGTCASSGAPCSTFGFVKGMLGAGDTLIVGQGGGGNYSGTSLDNSSGTNPGTDHGSGAITIQAASGVAVTFGYIQTDQPYWHYIGINCDGSGFSNVCIDNQVSHTYFAGVDDSHRMEIKNARDSGIFAENYYPVGTTDVHFRYFRSHHNGIQMGNPALVAPHGAYWESASGLIEDCELDHNSSSLGGYGIQIYNNTNNSHAHDNVLRNCSIHDNVGGVAWQAQSDNGLAYNLRIFDNLASGIDAVNIVNFRFCQNTVTGNLTFGIQAQSTVSSSVFCNNIVWNNASMGGSDLSDTGSGDADSNNLVGVDPLFTNAGTKDFTLQSMSPAIAYGADLSPTGIVGLAYDATGLLRPSIPSAGAYDVPGGSCTPHHLGFIDQPMNAVLGASVGTITIGIYNSGGAHCPSATNTVTLTKTSGQCPGMTLNGTISSAAVAGNFSESDVNLTVATGVCQLDASASGLTGATSDPFTISAAIGVTLNPHMLRN